MSAGINIDVELRKDMENQKVTGKQIVAGLAGVLLLIVFDQFTKLWAIDALKGKPPIVWIKGVFELQYLENRGAAFGLMQDQRWLFLICVILVVGAAGYFYLRLPSSRRYTPLRIIAVALVAGALGNAIDRIFRGFVVDFFYFSLINFPVFNVADIYVTVSMACFLVLFFFYYKEEDFKCLSAKKDKE